MPRAAAFAVALTVLAAACTSGLGPGDGPVGVGMGAPDFELPALDGGTLRLSSLRGKVVFLNFWTTWCAPCLVEMPAMDGLNRTLNRPDFVMLGLSVDEGGASAIREALQGQELSFRLLLDAARSQRRLDSHTGIAYGITGVPETFIIDRNGIIVRHQVGPVDWTSPEELDYFRRLLGPA